MTCSLGWENVALTGTISADAEVTGLGAGNLQTVHGATSTSWQTPVGTTSAYILLDAGAATDWDVVSIHNTNLTADATWRVRLGADATFATSTYDSGTLSNGVVEGYRQAVHVLASTVSARYLRIDLADASNPEACLRVAQLYAGPLNTPQRNFGFATAVQRGIEAPSVVTRGGQEFTEFRFARRGWSLSMPALHPDDVWTFVGELERAAEAGANILFLPFPTGADVAREAVFGRLAGNSAIGWPAQTPRLRSWSATITERL